MFGLASGFFREALLDGFANYFIVYLLLVINFSFVIKYLLVKKLSRLFASIFTRIGFAVFSLGFLIASLIFGLHFIDFLIFSVCLS
jgi:hypothetical protein